MPRETKQEKELRLAREALDARIQERVSAREKERERETEILAHYQESHALRGVVVEAVLNANWSSDQVKANFVQATDLFNIGNLYYADERGPDAEAYRQRIIDTVNGWPGACPDGRREFLRRTQLDGPSPRAKRARKAAEDAKAKGETIIEPGQHDPDMADEVRRVVR